MTPAHRSIRSLPGQRWWARTQAIPPALTGTVLARPRLEDRLVRAATRRLTVVVAGAGAGKSTLLASWAAPRRVAWYTVTDADRDLGHLASGLLGSLGLRVPALPGEVAGRLDQALGPEASGDDRARARACAGLLADALAAHLGRGLILVLDDAQELRAGDPGTSLVEALCRQAPEALHIVIASRAPLPFSIERLRGQGHVTALAAAALAFEPAEVEAMAGLHLDADRADRADLAIRLHAATGGWPAAVRLAVEALADVPAHDRTAMVERLLQPTGPVFDYLADEVIGREPPGVRELLETVAPLPRFCAPLAEDLGIAAAAEMLRSLDERGLFVRPVGEGGWFLLHPLMAQHVARRQVDREWHSMVLRTAAAWFERQAEWHDAITCHAAAGDPGAVARLLGTLGEQLLLGGDVATVAEWCRWLPPRERTPTIEGLDGRARQIRGDWEGALTCFRRLASEGRLDPGIAWRMGLIHHLRGELDEALETYRRGRAGPGSELRDEALLHAWLAAALWLRGEHDACRTGSEHALAAAIEADDDQALAAAHTTAAMVAALDGDRRANDAHYLRALDHATRARDVLQVIRIRANRGSRLAEEGYYEEALDELRDGIALAEVTGFAAFHALALSNRGEVLRRLGRLDEAIADLEASRALYQRLESRLVSYPLAHLGDVQAERGAFAVATACYEEAIGVATVPRDVQGLRPASAGLAVLLAARDPHRARELAERAVGFGPGIGLVRSLLAQGRVELARPDGAGRATAVTCATRAAAEARARRDRAGLAESLELEADATRDDTAAIRLLGEALRIWDDVRAPVAAARVSCRHAERSGAPAPESALETLRRAGATPERLALPSVVIDVAGSGPSIVIRTFGGFEVTRDGVLVTTAAWGSRKARDLLKILVCRRGRHVPRDQIVDLLWPGEDTTRAGRRLSGLISTLRAILDPRHECPPDRYVAADRAAVWLESDRLRIDLEEFLGDAATGLDREVGSADAGERLRRAEAIHRGEFLVEDAFEDWSAAMREECRQAYAMVAHRLAEIASASGDPAAAVMYRRRVLEHDEYDERAHLGLTESLAAAGRPADARRAYGAYLARMEELGVEPAPFPV